MSSFTSKKNEIISKLGRYRDDSDKVAESYLSLMRNLVTSFRKMEEKQSNKETLTVEDYQDAIISMQSDFNTGVAFVENYYSSLTKNYVTALKEISKLREDDTNE